MLSLVLSGIMALHAVTPAAVAASSAVPAVTLQAEDSGASRTRSLLEAAASCLQAIDNLEARFLQVAPSGNISTGKFFLSRPGKMRFDYDAPNPTTVIATGGLVYIHDEELNTTESYPVGETPLRYLLAKELDLDSAQVVGVEENEHGIKIILAAKDQNLQGQLALLFKPEPLTLAGWSFLDPNGELTMVSLEAVEEPRRLSSRLFRVPEAGGTFLRDN
ncbi:MAG: outer membrane lipoprotein carrier protein LolA [Parvularcula sp.]|jgi:outer membrane lipoprotein-sorting protein|nr:outer membrane lipoprotein carrier protein LolA [Parvularcula sp.]